MDDKRTLRACSQVVVALRLMMETLADEDRLQVMDAVSYGYCLDCGRAFEPDDQGACFCRTKEA